jgi:hypothetical protein
MTKDERQSHFVLSFFEAKKSIIALTKVTFEGK